MKRTLFTLVLTFCFSLAANAATYTVNNTNDSGPGSLRAGLSSAANGDRITFNVTGTITLTSAQLVIGANVTIIGPGAGKLAITGNGGFPVFQVNSGVTAATISGVTIEGGYSNSMPGGGGINNLGTLTVSHSTLLGNFAEANESNNGGAIYNSGTLTVSNSIVSDNGAFSIGGNGGGIYNTGTLTVSYSSFPGNGVGSPGGSGADIYNASSGTLLVSHSTMSGATCCGGAGGDIYSGGSATIATTAPCRIARTTRALVAPFTTVAR